MILANWEFTLRTEKSKLLINNMKKYCRDCKYNSYYICKYFKPELDEYTGNKKSLDFHDEYKGNNNDGECKYYKDKLYKILKIKLKNVIKKKNFSGKTLKRRNATITR